MALPYRAGGIGLTETLTTSHAAFTASCALAIPDIAPLILQDEQARHCPTFADILESSAFLTRAGVNVPLPTSTQEILDFYSDGDSEKHLQGDLMSNYYDSCLNNLFDDPQASDADIACLIASQASNSSKWLHLNSNTPTLLSDEASSIALISHSLRFVLTHHAAVANG